MNVVLQIGLGALVRKEKNVLIKPGKTSLFWFISCVQKRLGQKLQHILFQKTHLQP